ncbi:MAG: hypothetical protein NT023_23325 [Armatimonadetes bacterium]|nr:hypothetical protein [Armatimonadota bacterium]
MTTSFKNPAESFGGRIPCPTLGDSGFEASNAHVCGGAAGSH